MDSLEKCDTKSADDLSQALCRACGLCCDGSLYAFAVIVPDEDVIQLERGGITTICDDGKTFTLPCKSFNRICTIYHTRRARVCGAYVCKLLKRHNRGVISYKRAEEIISQTKAHKKKTQASFIAIYGASESNLEQQYQDLKSQSDLKSSVHNVAVLNFLALQLQLDRHFRGVGEAVIPKLDTHCD